MNNNSIQEQYNNIESTKNIDKKLKSDIEKLYKFSLNPKGNDTKTIEKLNNSIVESYSKLFFSKITGNSNIYIYIHRKFV